MGGQTGGLVDVWAGTGPAFKMVLGRSHGELTDERAGGLVSRMRAGGWLCGRAG